MFDDGVEVAPGMLAVHIDGLRYRVNDVVDSTDGSENRGHQLLGGRTVYYTQLEAGSFPAGKKWSKGEVEFREFFTPLEDPALSFLNTRANLDAHETDPETLDAQITAGLEVRQGSAFRFLNNFFNKLPDGIYDQQMRETGLTDIPREKGFEDDDSLVALHSCRYLAGTYEDMQRDINIAIHFSGVDLEELERLHEAFKVSSMPERAAAIEALSKFILPVYRHLRMLGYSHYDMWC